jgi:5-methylcytosine-specific restriction protein A
MSRRSDAANAYRHLYKTAAWQWLRKQHLEAHPLCAMCEKIGHVTAAEVVDHIKPHKGDRILFFDPANLSSLCKWHHDSVKQAEEKRGYSNEIGLDGRPVDPNHPGYN